MATKPFHLGLCLVFAMVGGAAAQSTSPIDTLKPGEWVEIPNSKLSESGVYPPVPTPPGDPVCVMTAWSGAAYDSKRDRLVITGGGHGDYSGNEIYVFDLKSLKWSRPWGPSVVGDIPAASAMESRDTYLDGAPAAVHSYDGMIYLAAQDRLWRGGGSKWSGSGGGTRAGWYFDFNTLTWERRGNASVLGVSIASDFDPVTGHIFCLSDTGPFGEYDPAANTWTIRDVDGMSRGEEPNAAIDPVSRHFVATANGRFFALDLRTMQVVKTSTSGPQSVVAARGPGIMYDPGSKKIVGWAGGTSVYSLDTSTWTWTEHPAAATNTVTPTAITRVGVYGRFNYVPSKNAFILVNRVTDNVFVYKLSPGGGSPTPAAPVITSQPANRSVTAGQTATFSVTATGAATLSYRWQKNGSDIAGATGSSYTTPPTTSSDNGATFRVIVSNSAGSVTSSSATLTVQPAGGSALPSPWLHQDVGAVVLAGSASVTGGTFHLNGSGADIWNASDAFHYVYQTLTGDATIVARITGIGNTDPWAKVGVMIRESLDPGSRYADTILTPSNGALFQWRESTGGSSESSATTAAVAPAWVKLVRSGDTFSGFVSFDGSTWTQLGSDTEIPMGDPVYLGLCVTAHTTSAINSAMADSVSVSETAAPGGGGGGAPPPSSGSGSKRRGGCGATGMEVCIILAVWAILRRA